MVTPKKQLTHDDPTTKSFEGAAKIAARISSYDDAMAYFEGETGADIDRVIASLVQQKKSLLRKGTSLEAAQDMARDGCAHALQQAVSKHKQSVLEQALLSERSVTPYTREEYEADMRGIGESPAFLNFDSMFQRRQSVTRGNAKASRSDNEETRTIGNRLSDLAGSARKAREQVAELIAELDHLSRMNLLNAPVARNSRTPTHEDIFKREIHNTVTNCRNALAAVDCFVTLTDRLSQSRVVGRRPDLFRSAFVAAMIPVWEQLTGHLPKRENQRMLDLLSVAYTCFADDGFEGWDSVLRTELSKIPKQSAKRTPKGRRA